MNYYPITKEFLTNLIGFGVAGNFAGHLEQAGETPDFVDVETISANAPKGLFPYYIPNSDGVIGEYPLSTNEIHYPKDLDTNAHLQAEAEVCVLFEVAYESGTVFSLTPKAFAAFNDCSIRKPGAKKISEKKNWGPATKGISQQFIPLSSFTEGCELDNYRIASFLKRSGKLHEYGTDSLATSYSYFHEQLSEWMISKLNTQADFGPLEDLHSIIKSTNNPEQILISLGATCYTEFGETVFLQPGDEVFIYVYDATMNSLDDVFEHANGAEINLQNSSILQQKIV